MRHKRVGSDARDRSNSNAFLLGDGGAFRFAGLRSLNFASSKVNMIEILNAITMFVPTVVGWSFAGYCDYMEAPYEPFCRSAVLASPLHLVPAAAYHMYSAFNPEPAKHSLTLRRLDNSFILMTGSAFAHALSASHYYGLLAFCLNLAMAATFWRKGRGAKPGIPEFALCVLVYTAPMLFYGKPLDFLATLAAFGLALWVYIDPKKIFKKHAHPLMHVLLGLPTLLLVRFAVQNLEVISVAAAAAADAELAAAAAAAASARGNGAHIGFAGRVLAGFLAERLHLGALTSKLGNVLQAVPR